MSSLGSNGRFGNTLFQAAFIMGFANKHNFTCEIPMDWVGRKIFKINNPGISKHLKHCPLDFIPHEDQIKLFPEGINFFGYYQFQDAINFYSINKILNWFEFQPWVLEKFPRPEAEYAACHLRRGDYLSLQHCFCIPSNASYHRMLESLQLKMPVRWISEEKPRIDVELEAQGLGFLPDFMQLYHASILLRSNSTFSWWAATLAQNNVLSPVVEDKVGIQDVEFGFGNWPRMADSKHHAAKITDLVLRYV